MSWQARDYAGDDYGTRPTLRGGNPLGNVSATTAIIIANIVMYFLTVNIAPGLLGYLVMQPRAVLHGQLWRLFTATYLHAGFAHIFFNMLGVYFFGPFLERAWGRREFFLVYTAGGVLGNIVLTIAGLVGFIDPRVPGLGASGSVLATLGAVAVLAPNTSVYLYFLFPVRLWILMVIYTGLYVLNVFQQGANYGGDLCHLGGVAAGVSWAWRGRRWWYARGAALVERFKPGRGGESPWERRMRQRLEDEETIDRILKKIHEHGMQSLTARERRELEAATRRRREEERRLTRVGRD